MASTAAQLTALATDAQFRARIQSLLVQVAGQVYSENPQAISAISQASPGVITCVGHGLTIGKTVTINVSGSNSTPSIDGQQQVYVVDASHLKTTVPVTVAGTAGTFTVPARGAFAAYVLANPGGVAQNVAAVIVNRTNLVAGGTTYDFVGGHIVTDVADGGISSQLATDWNLLSGV